MSTSQLTDEQKRFISDLVALLTAWAMPANVAHLYGYLQIRNEPASLDEIARDLEMSKSNAFNAARLLEGHGNARRISVRGSKRVLFVAGDDPGAPLHRQIEALGRMSALIAARKDEVATGPARDRLAGLARFHADLQAAMEAVVLPAGQSHAA